jgi:hypothetical protein
MDRNICGKANEMIPEDQVLSVSCEPIEIIALSLDGLLPLQGSLGGDNPPLRREPFICRHLPPRTATEETLLSMWVNIHQAMFISTGIAAQCVQDMCGLIRRQAPMRDVCDMAHLAAAARLSSAAYTSLPHLTLELYEAYVRPSMMTVHAGFSGVSNQEAITMEESLRALKEVHAEIAETNRDYAQALLPVRDRVFAADREWWKYHGMAMGKYVTDPTSLARMDFKIQQAHGSGDKLFQDYRDRVLRQVDAIADYDQYFAVKRQDDLSVDHYRQVLDVVLERSAPYVDSRGVLASYRADGTRALYQVLDLHS